MSSGDNAAPTRLLSVAHEVEAAALVAALADHGVEAFTIGGYISDFKAMAPARIDILVRPADLEPARAALAEIQQERAEVDWDQVDVTKGMEPEPPAQEEEDSSSATIWGVPQSRLVAILTIFALVACLVAGLFLGFSTSLVELIVLLVITIAILALGALLAQRY